MTRIQYLIGNSILLLLFMGCGEQQKKAAPAQEADVQPTAVGEPIGQHSSLPFLVANGERTLLSFVEKKGDSLTTLKYTELIKGEWQAPQEILSGTDWFVNWADFPMIAENKGNLWSHVLKKSTAGTYSYDVKMNVLPKGAAEWETNLALHTDGTPTEHGFVTVLPYKEGFFVCWLDGRNTLENEAGERGAMTIRAAEVAANGKLSAETELDVSSCDCCQTTAAITDSGPIVLYRDRSEEEVRDISIVRQVDGEWTTPKTIHDDGWQIKGCPVNGPKVAALGNTVVAAWFTAAEKNPRAQVAFSNDAGAHFDAPIPIAGAKALGRVDVLLLDGDTAIVSWLESYDKHAQLKAVKVSRSGTLSEYHVIMELDASRMTGFPQMEMVEDLIYFAWTDVSKAKSQIRVAKVLVTDF
ncbi:hypothetical protein N9954_05660 [Maribacter sp.]|nr:hypothetical protein [Maribacter sp.]